LKTIIGKSVSTTINSFSKQGYKLDRDILLFIFLRCQSINCRRWKSSKVKLQKPKLKANPLTTSNETFRKIWLPVSLNAYRH